MMGERIALWVYVLGDLATFVYLIAADAPDTHGLAWLVVIPVDLFLATIWPIYWLILHWIF